MVEQIAPGQLDYLAGVPETGAHYFSGIPELLIVSVISLTRLHPRIFRAFVIAIVGFSYTNRRSVRRMERSIAL